MFANRQHAGLLLAKQLKSLVEQELFNPKEWIGLGLPRGGIPVGLEIAMYLDCPLNVIASKKIGAPQQPELAVGAVTSDGVVVVDHRLIDYLGVPNLYLEREVSYLVNKTKEQECTLRKMAGLKFDLQLKDKNVIVVDDGVATGMTAIAAARSLHKHSARKLIFATPVASEQAYKVLCKEYDSVIVLEIPSEFKAVGQFYKDFCQVEDLEVIRALALAGNEHMVRVGGLIK
jgi:predicted phosphoribosyltransferase